MSFFPRKYKILAPYIKAYFRPQSLRLRGQWWGKRLWERKFLQFGHMDVSSGGPRLPPEVVSARLNFSGRGPKICFYLAKIKRAVPHIIGLRAKI